MGIMAFARARATVLVVPAGIVAAGLVPAALMAVRLAMAVAVRWTRCLLLAALFFGELRQVVRHHLDLHADHPLDIAQHAALGGVAKGNGDAFTAGARGAADAVHITFRLIGQLE